MIEPFHDRISEAVLAPLSDEAIRALHRRLVHALESAGDADPEALLNHLRAAGDLENAGKYAQAVLPLRSSARSRSIGLRSCIATALDLAPDGADCERASTSRRRCATRRAHSSRAKPTWARLRRRTTPRALELRRLAAEQLLRGAHVERGLTILKQVLAARI